jgi:hypothetical protein
MARLSAEEQRLGGADARHGPLSEHLLSSGTNRNDDIAFVLVSDLGSGTLNRWLLVE